MFFVTDMDKNGNVSVVDTNDMVIDTYKYNELYILKLQYNLDIIGFNQDIGSLVIRNLKISPKNCVFDSSYPDYRLNMQGLFLSGGIDRDLRFCDNCIMASDNTIYDFCCRYKLSGLQNLIVRYLSLCSYGGLHKLLLFDLLADLYVNRVRKELKFNKTLEYVIWGSSILSDILQRINIYEINDTVYFVDEEIVIGIKKSKLDKYKEADTFNAKSAMFKTNIELEASTGEYIILNCDKFTASNDGRTYKLLNNTSINVLTIEEGAKINIKRKYLDNIKCFHCLDEGIFNKLRNKHAVRPNEFIIPLDFVVDELVTADDLSTLYKYKNFNYCSVGKERGTRFLNHIMYLLSCKFYIDNDDYNYLLYLESLFKKNNIDCDLLSRFDLQSSPKFIADTYLKYNKVQSLDYLRSVLPRNVYDVILTYFGANIPIFNHNQLSSKFVSSYFYRILSSIKPNELKIFIDFYDYLASLVISYNLNISLLGSNELGVIFNTSDNFKNLVQVEYFPFEFSTRYLNALNKLLGELYIIDKLLPDKTQFRNSLDAYKGGVVLNVKGRDFYISLIKRGFDYIKLNKIKD